MSMQTIPKNRKRSKKTAVIISLAAFSLLVVITFLIYLTIDRQNKQRTFTEFERRITALTYKDVYLAKDLSEKKISRLSTDLSENKTKMTEKSYKRLSGKLKQISAKYSKLSEVNALFSSAAISGDEIVSAAIKDDLTQNEVKTVKLTNLDKSQFTVELSRAVQDADNQLAQIEKVKTEIKNNTASTTVASDISEIKNTQLQTSYTTQLRTRDANAVKAKYAGKKIIALTFDDGPSDKTTPKLLDILKQNGVKATFCELGQNIQLHQDITKRVAAEGHEIISHSWSHPDLTKLSKEDVQSQVEDTSALIKQVSGQDNPLYRPPYGSTNDAVLSEINRAAFEWDIDTEDWRDSTSEPVVKAAVEAAHDKGVILMHDIHAWSVDAVPEIIKQLKAQGYTFVTASELVQVKYGAIMPHQVYY
ncbi:hypothetical protein OfM2_15050 [Lactovum odontotermitis]